MAFNAYASSLRGERGPQERLVESGVPFFVPQLSKVKTNVMCQTKNQHLLFCFEKSGGSTGDAATLASASYRKQGNQDLYSPENLLKRQSLQDDKHVVAALGRFWDTFPHVRQGHQTLDRRDYVDVFMKFFKALVTPSEFSMAEARKIVERDWERDMGDAEVMTRTVFFRSLFEVADIWTIGIGSDIYTSFLNKLYDRVTMTVYDQEKAMWLTVFADIDKIRPFAESRVEQIIPAPSSTTVAEQLTNQDQDCSAGSESTSPQSGVSSASLAKPKPPLLKKKTLSVPSGLGSPTKSSAIHMLGSAESMGGSLRRLPDLQAVANEAVRTLQSGIVARPPRSPVAQVSEAVSSRSEGGIPMATSQDVASENYVDRIARMGVQSSPTKSPLRTVQKAPVGRKDTTSVSSRPSQRKKGEGDESPQASVSPVPDISPLHVRLAMPSIYLSPEIKPANGTEKAARRRIRESMKLAQRLRRITY